MYEWYTALLALYQEFIIYTEGIYYELLVVHYMQPYQCIVVHKVVTEYYFNMWFSVQLIHKLYSRQYSVIFFVWEINSSTCGLWFYWWETSKQHWYFINRPIFSMCLEWRNYEVIKKFRINQRVKCYCAICTSQHCNRTEQFEEWTKENSTEEIFTEEICKENNTEITSISFNKIPYPLPENLCLLHNAYETGTKSFPTNLVPTYNIQKPTPMEMLIVVKVGMMWLCIKVLH